MIMEYIQAYPRISAVVIALLVSLFITIVNYFLLDKEKLRELRQKQKQLNKDIKAHTDPAKKMELSNEMMKQSLESMRHSFKPMIVTFIPVLVVFWFIKGAFAETMIGGSWFWYYLGGAIVGSLIFKKLFNLP